MQRSFLYDARICGNVNKLQTLKQKVAKCNFLWYDVEKVKVILKIRSFLWHIKVAE